MKTNQYSRKGHPGFVQKYNFFLGFFFGFFSVLVFGVSFFFFSSLFMEFRVPFYNLFVICTHLFHSRSASIIRKPFQLTFENCDEHID